MPIAEHNDNATEVDFAASGVFGRLVVPQSEQQRQEEDEQEEAMIAAAYEAVRSGAGAFGRLFAPRAAPRQVSTIAEEDINEAGSTTQTPTHTDDIAIEQPYGYAPASAQSDPSSRVADAVARAVTERDERALQARAPPLH